MLNQLLLVLGNVQKQAELYSDFLNENYNLKENYYKRQNQLIKGLDEGIRSKSDGAHGQRWWALILMSIPISSPNLTLFRI